jgi:hypothetical protein
LVGTKVDVMGRSASVRRRLTVGGVALGVAAGAVVAGIATGPSALADNGGGHNPKGNNGTFKVDGVPYDDGIDNEPHVTCEFRLVFFGFDKDQRGSIEFTGQPPSGRGRVGGLNNVLLSDDDAGGGLNDRDAIFYFTADDLDLSRLKAHPKQGYHIKVTVLTGEPGGKKHKVFWLKPCGGGGGVTPSPTQTTRPPTTGSPTATASPTETETTTPPASPTATETSGPAGTSTPSPSVSGVVTTSPGGGPGSTPGATVGGVVLTTAPAAGGPEVLGTKQTRGAGGLALSGFAMLGLVFAGLALLAAGVIAVVAVRRHGAMGTD